MRTPVSVTSWRRGSPARSRSSASFACRRCATRSGRRSAITVLVVQELDLLLAELGHLQLLDEMYDLAQTAVDVRLVGADLAHAKGRLLPEIVVVALGDRHVELVLHARLDGTQHAALALQRVVLRQPQLEAEHPDHHGRRAVRPGARPPDRRPSPRRAPAGGRPARP